MNLTNYSSRKILAEQKEFVPEIDYKKESLINPVPLKWKHQFKNGQGNEMNTTKGTVILRDGWMQPVMIRRFVDRRQRNRIVRGLADTYKGKNRHYVVCVEFD